MNILCISNSLDNKVLYAFIKMLLGNCIVRDVTGRTPYIMAKINGVEVKIGFVSFSQNVLAVSGLRPSLLIVHGDPPKEWVDFIKSVRITGGLVLNL